MASDATPAVGSHSFVLASTPGLPSQSGSSAQSISGFTPQIIVEQPIGNRLYDGSGSIDFGLVRNGSTADIEVFIGNSGTAILTLGTLSINGTDAALFTLVSPVPSGLGMSFSGPDAALFSVTLAPVAPIAPAGSSTFIVRFAPVIAGFRSAALHVVSNNADENPFDIQLTGIGTALPSATTLPAASGTPTTATLNATVHPRGLATAVHFDVGTSDLYGSVTPTINLAAGASSVAIAAPITGLLANTNCHYRVVAQSSGGTRQGTDSSFSTRNDMLTIVSYYRMGDIDPDAAPLSTTAQTRDSVGTNHLTVSGAPYVSDVASNAFAVTGSSLAMSYPDNAAQTRGPVVSAVTDNFGIEAWVKLNGTGGDYTIAYNGNTATNGWGLVHNSNIVARIFGGIGLIGPAPTVANQWMHVALVRASGVATLYVNGIAAGSSTQAPLAPTGLFRIGEGPGPTSRNIDEVRVFTFPPGQFRVRDLLLDRIFKNGFE